MEIISNQEEVWFALYHLVGVMTTSRNVTWRGCGVCISSYYFKTFYATSEARPIKNYATLDYTI